MTDWTRPAAAALRHRARQHPEAMAWRITRMACGAAAWSLRPGDEWDRARERLFALAREIGAVRA